MAQAHGPGLPRGRPGLSFQLQPSPGLAAAAMWDRNRLAHYKLQLLSDYAHVWLLEQSNAQTGSDSGPRVCREGVRSGCCMGTKLELERRACQLLPTSHWQPLPRRANRAWSPPLEPGTWQEVEETAMQWACSRPWQWEMVRIYHGGGRERLHNHQAMGSSLHGTTRTHPRHASQASGCELQAVQSPGYP